MCPSLRLKTPAAEWRPETEADALPLFLQRHLQRCAWASPTQNQQLPFPDHSKPPAQFPPSNPTPPPVLGRLEARRKGPKKVPAAPNEPTPQLQRTHLNCSKKCLDDAPTRAAATALPGQAAVGTGRRGARPGARAAAHSPGMGDEVVHGDLHRLALGDLSEGFEDELVVKGI